MRARAGYENLSLNNSGTINANATNNTLTIGGDGGAITDSGLMEATNGGTLSLASAAAINNAGGTISAIDPAKIASTVNVSTTIEGGTWTTTGVGVMQTVGTATLDASSHGAITLSDGSTYTAGGSSNTKVTETSNSTSAHPRAARWR